MPTEYSYLDEEPQEIKPLKLEVPILHMAIVDVSFIFLFPLVDDEVARLMELKTFLAK